jgi:hypothetical protein
LFLERRGFLVLFGKNNPLFCKEGMEYRYMPNKLPPKYVKGAKRVPLTKGKFALVDAKDYDRVVAHKWCAVAGNKSGTVCGMQGARLRGTCTDSCSMPPKCLRSITGMVTDLTTAGKTYALLPMLRTAITAKSGWALPPSIRE